MMAIIFHSNVFHWGLNCGPLAPAANAKESMFGPIDDSRMRFADVEIANAQTIEIEAPSSSISSLSPPLFCPTAIVQLSAIPLFRFAGNFSESENMSDFSKCDSLEFSLVCGLARYQSRNTMFF
jgi:hypothetical protein